MKPFIKVGDTFTTKHGNSFKRLDDDKKPTFESERILLVHLSHPDYHPSKWEPYTFGTEQEWFKQRGLIAA